MAGSTDKNLNVDDDDIVREEKVADELKNLSFVESNWDVFLENLKKEGIEDIEFHDSVEACEYFSDGTILVPRYYFKIEEAEDIKKLVTSMQNFRMIAVMKAVQKCQKNQKIVFLNRDRLTVASLFDISNGVPKVRAVERYVVGLVDKDATILGR